MIHGFKGKKTPKLILSINNGNRVPCLITLELVIPVDEQARKHPASPIPSLHLLPQPPFSSPSQFPRMVDCPKETNSTNCFGFVINRQRILVRLGLKNVLPHLVSTDLCQNLKIGKHTFLSVGPGNPFHLFLCSGKESR